MPNHKTKAWNGSGWMTALAVLILAGFALLSFNLVSFNLVTFYPVTGANAQDVADKSQPEGDSGINQPAIVTASDYMVVAANPYAAMAGEKILEAGGNAIDAMVSVQLVLGLVEPQSSGLGGGAFLVHYHAATKKLVTLDGRETAPAKAMPELFLDAKGQPINFMQAVIGGRSVATPGTVRLLYDAHARYGKLPWKELFQPAIKLAREGFKVSPRLNALISQSAQSLYANEVTRDYFLSEEAVPIFVNTVLQNPAYADTLTKIAENGPEAFYKGEIAADIVKTVANAKGNPGLLSLEDLAGYKTIEREAVCSNYRGFEICGMGAPSSGMITIGQILKMLEPYDLRAYGATNPQSWRLIGDASRLAFADRDRYIADPAFFKMPKGLLNSDYLKSRARLLEGQNALAPDAVKPGNPPSDHAALYGKNQALELPSTSHFSIIDHEGNVVSMTTTIENAFGSQLMVRGFLLNNELTDFSFVPEEKTANGSHAVANRVEGGKRPRSSMAPTIILKDGKPYMAIGSPGGSNIIGYVAQAIIAHIDWQLPLQEAVALPHLNNRFGIYEIEEGTAAEELAAPLEALGYETRITPLNSGLHGILIGERLESAVDPRREGMALGK